MPWNRYLPLRDSKLKDTGYITSPHVIDAHSHLHLHIPREGQPPLKNFYEVSDQLFHKEKAGFIPTETLIKEMDRYGVDKSIIHLNIYKPVKNLSRIYKKTIN